MKRLLKILLGLFVVLLLLVAAFAFTFDANRYKPKIIQVVKENTGRELKIPGDISLSLFPWIGLELGSVELANARGFGKKPFARIEHLQLRVRLWPLLKKHIEADTLVVEGLQLNLAKNRHGKSNWDDLLTPRRKVTGAKNTQRPSGKTGRTKTLAAFAINGIRINKARLSWYNHQSGQRLLIAPLDLSMGRIMADTPIPLDARFRFSEKRFNSTVKLSAAWQFSSDLKRFRLDKLRLGFDDSLITGQASLVLPALASKLELKLDRINLDPYLSKFESTQPGTIKVTKVKQQKKPKEVALIPLALLSDLDLEVRLGVGDLQVKNTIWNDLTLTAWARHGKVRVPSLTANGYDATIKAAMNLTALKQDARLNGTLDIVDISAGKILNDLLQKDKLRGKATLKAKFSSRGLLLSQLKQNLDGNLNLKLDNATLKGFDLNHQKKVLDALLKKQPIPKAPIEKQTRIARLTASAVINKGVVNNRDLRAATPLSRVAGKGRLDIAREKINYTVLVKFVSSTAINDGLSYDSIKADPLLIRISGGFDQPKVKVDFQALVKQQVDRVIKKEKKKIEEKVKQDINKAIKKKLGTELQKLLKF